MLIEKHYRVNKIFLIDIWLLNVNLCFLNLIITEDIMGCWEKFFCCCCSKGKKNKVKQSPHPQLETPLDVILPTESASPQAAEAGPPAEEVSTSVALPAFKFTPENLNTQEARTALQNFVEAHFMAADDKLDARAANICEPYDYLISQCCAKQINTSACLAKIKINIEAMKSFGHLDGTKISEEELAFFTELLDSAEKYVTTIKSMEVRHPCGKEESKASSQRLEDKQEASSSEHILGPTWQENVANWGFSPPSPTDQAPTDWASLDTLPNPTESASPDSEKPTGSTANATPSTSASPEVHGASTLDKISPSDKEVVLQFASTDNDTENTETDDQLDAYLLQNCGFSLSGLEDAPEFARMQMQKAIEMAQKALAERQQKKHTFEEHLSPSIDSTENSSHYSSPEAKIELPDFAKYIGAHIETSSSDTFSTVILDNQVF